MDYKLIYLARRHPSLREDEFPEAWRSHSRLSSQFVTTFGSHFRRVRQCVKAYELDPPVLFRNAFDGCALLDMKSWDDLVAARSHPRAQGELKKDEERVFADFVDPWTMAAEERVLRHGSSADHVMLTFLSPRPDLAESDFAQGLDSLGEALLTCPAAGGCPVTINRVVDPSEVYGFGAVVEIWFEDADSMLKASRDGDLYDILVARDIADSDSNVMLLARLNLTKTISATPAGGAAWSEA